MLRCLEKFKRNLCREFISLKPSHARGQDTTALWVFLLAVTMFLAVLHTIVRAAIGAAWKKTETRYAARLGGSSRTIRATGRTVKSGV